MFAQHTRGAVVNENGREALVKGPGDLHRVLNLRVLYGRYIAVPEGLATCGLGFGSRKADCPSTNLVLGCSMRVVLKWI